MRTLVFISFLLIASFVFGQEKEWYAPSISIPFSTVNGDTSYYSMVDSKTHKEIEKASIWRIRKGDTLYDYYPKGNLQSIESIKQVKVENWINTNKVEYTSKVYEYDGWCKIFFDDSTKTLVAIGQCANKKFVGEWKHYDRQGRLILKSYPMWFWIRTDYYDPTGQLYRQADEVDNGIDKGSTVRDVEFINGQERIIVNKNLFVKLLLRFTIIWLIMFLGSFFLRIPFNHVLYWREGKSRVSLFWFPGSKTSLSEAFLHQLKVFYTFWWRRVKPENKVLATISNTLSVIALILFFGPLIIMAISGELS